MVQNAKKPEVTDLRLFIDSSDSHLDQYDPDDSDQSLVQQIQYEHTAAAAECFLLLREQDHQELYPDEIALLCERAGCFFFPADGSAMESRLFGYSARPERFSLRHRRLFFWNRRKNG